MSGEHSCAGSSGKSPDHAGECANPQPDPVSPGETTFMASTPKSRWQRIRPPASPVVAGRGVARTSVKIDKSPSPMAPKLSKRSLDSPLEGAGFELPVRGSDRDQRVRKSDIRDRKCAIGLRQPSLDSSRLGLMRLQG